MRTEFSVYLDAVRFSAAMMVVASHFTFPQFIASVQYQGELAGIGVTVFFVLSGYVIAYVTDTKEHNLRDFAVSRLARIYSVAIPALILTVLIDLFLLRHGAGQNVPLYEYSGFWKYLPIFITFTNEIGFLHVEVLTDGVFWSLSYEVWYYIVFGAIFYLRGAWRIAVGGAAIIILGLPALLYFPIWFLGVLCYYLHKGTSLPLGFARTGAVMTAAMIIGAWSFGVLDWADITADTLLGGTGARAISAGWPIMHLHSSVGFASHYIVGILVASHFFLIRYCSLGLLANHQVRKIIVYLASFTFAIYLSHRPLMDLWAYLLDHDPHSLAAVALLAGTVMISVWLFSLVSERRKGWWRLLFTQLLRAPAPLKVPQT